MLLLISCWNLWVVGGRTQIKREISTMKMVKHPNIVQLLEVSSQQLLSLSLSVSGDSYIHAKLELDFCFVF